MTIRALMVVAGFALATSAQAVCYRDGKPYPTWAVVNGYQCQPDGTWRKLPAPAQSMPAVSTLPVR
jgi:hypothetical protein